MAQKYKLTIAYDGGAYHGWQVQPNGVSIQELLQKHLTTMLQEPAYVTGSGRTDAGVHAKGQTAHFSTDKTIDTKILRYALNGLLPKDIRILCVEPAAEDFHARYSAIGKEYHYHIRTDTVENPFTWRYHWKVGYRLDLDLLCQSTKEFVGTHDFTSFANEGHKGAAAKNAVRTLYRLDFIPEEGGFRLEFEGNGFLYKMVRNIVGMLIEVSSGKRAITEIAELLKQKDRRLAARAAPAHGLFLMKVIYR